MVDRFAIQLTVAIRHCREQDLCTLEWFGMFAPDREVIAEQYRRQLVGEAAILVADVNGVASGQVWIDFARLPEQAIGVLWALRVFPALQGLGIGTRLIAVGERLIRHRDGREAELEVAPTNTGAQRLYERIGYRHLATAGDSGHLVLRKRLRRQARSAGAAIA